MSVFDRKEIERTPEDVVRRARRAKELLADPLLSEVLDELELEAVRAFRMNPAGHAHFYGIMTAREMVEKSLGIISTAGEDIPSR